MEADKANLYADVGDQEGRNANLQGGKSTQAHVEEAHEEQATAANQEKVKTDNEPVECKAATELLPDDAETKAKHSE